jgi:hypothetical protein
MCPSEQEIRIIEYIVSEVALSINSDWMIMEYGFPDRKERDTEELIGRNIQRHVINVTSWSARR